MQNVTDPSPLSALRADLLQRVSERLLRLPETRISRVAIDGVDGAGKTVFADELATALAPSGRQIIRASVDGFHSPREVRHRRGRDSPEGFYLDSYDYEALRRHLLDPLGPGGSRAYRAVVFDHTTDCPVTGDEQIATLNSILIIDGIFLHRAELRDCWDYSLFLRAPFSVSIPRGAQRSPGLVSPDPSAESNRRYVEGQRLYLRQDDPETRAHMVVDNSELAAPEIVREGRGSPMRLRVVDSVTAPGAVVNEDCWGFNGQAAWVMDGATGVWPEQRLSQPSDAAWFVAQCDIILRKTFRGDKSPIEILRGATRTVSDLARGLYAIDGLAPYELPSASFAAVRAVAEGIELTNLGDCLTLWRSGSCPVQCFGSSAVTQLDEQLAVRVSELLASGRSMSEVDTDIAAMARQHRMLMNQPGGYWILDMSGIGTAHLQVEMVDAGSLQLLLMSDGFSRLVDVYGRYDFDQLLEAAYSRGLTVLLDELRDIEADDDACKAFPRGKARDDATAVLLQAF